MRVAFRTDASVHIGYGHVMRCLSLANHLSKIGVECVFICRPHKGHLIDAILKSGHGVLILPVLIDKKEVDETSTYESWLGTHWFSDAKETSYLLRNQLFDWLIVDHYGLDFRWESVLRASCKYIMVIDDLANRSHDCDLFLDQNLGRSIDDYSNLLPSKVIPLFGPKFALLRPEFSLLRKESLARRADICLKNLIITMGGVDAANITSRVIEALKSITLPQDLKIIIVMGLDSPRVKEVRERAASLKCATEVLVGANNMAQLMVDSDLCIGAAGGTSWERCCLGLASIVIPVADNQLVIANALSREGAIVLINNIDELSSSLDNFFRLIDKDSVIREMSHQSSKITDGGGSMRVSSHILNPGRKMDLLNID